jgi:cell division protein FtsZ
MEGAHGVLLSISGGSDLGIFEINEAASMVADSAHPEANIIFGAIIDDALGDEVRVTVIAAGFDGGSPKHKPIEAQRRDPAPAGGSPLPPSASTTPTVTSRYGPPATASPRGGSAGSSGLSSNGGHVRRAVELDEELDIPDFLKG